MTTGATARAGTRAWLSALLCVVGTECSNSSPGTSELDAKAPGAVDPQAFDLDLDARMWRHRDQTEALRRAVWALDYDRIAPLADALASDSVTPARVSWHDERRQPPLDDAFKLHERELQRAAAVLAKAARTRDDGRIDDAFAVVSATCSSCHATYRMESREDRAQ